jgi:hypothetical protein
MYSNNAVSLTRQDKVFQDILGNAVETIQSRLNNYDQWNDPLERERLRFLYDIVTLEMDKVASGRTDGYSGLEGPMMAISDWGEPQNSLLMRALRDVEAFFHRNYWDEEARQTVH